MPCRDRIGSAFGTSSASSAAGSSFAPGAITLAMAALAVGLTDVEERITAVQAWSDFLDRVFPPEPEAAHVVLGTIAGSMITVVSVVYSILLVVLTFASTQFSPRVLVAFVEDRVSQTTLGVFVGTFTYCLLTLPAVRSQPKPFVPSIAVIVAIVLAIACLACLLYFIHHMASSIQASQIVDRVARETERVLDDLFPRPLDGPPAERAVAIRSRAERRCSRPRSGYIRSVDESSLLAAARAADAALRIRSLHRTVRHRGHTPPRGHRPADRATGALRAACLRAFDIGPARTMEQDVEFGVLQIVDIALKAISPAVNDPTTALTCIDQLGRILVRAAMRRPPISTLRDADGRARVVLRAHLVPPPARRRIQPDRPLREGGRRRATAADARPGRAGRRDATWPLRRRDPRPGATAVGGLRPGFPRRRPRRAERAARRRRAGRGGHPDRRWDRVPVALLSRSDVPCAVGLSP